MLKMAGEDEASEGPLKRLEEKQGEEHPAPRLLFTIFSVLGYPVHRSSELNVQY